MRLLLTQTYLPRSKRYDVGNRELLAIKVALEEWHHWLEGTDQPFMIWTEHNNLEYLKEAQCLNPWQARWALFFTRFNYTLSYPLPKNTKPDALSRLHSPKDNPTEPSTVLQPQRIIGQVRWTLMAAI